MGISEKALDILMNYNWPEMSELEHVIQRLQYYAKKKLYKLNI